jgi:hypothetical protein
MELYKEIEKTFPKICEYLTPERVLHFRHTPPSDLQLYNEDLGPWVRSILLCPKKSRLHRLFTEFGIDCEDEMSGMVIALYHRYLTHLR